MRKLIVVLFLISTTPCWAQIIDDDYVKLASHEIVIAPRRTNLVFHTHYDLNKGIMLLSYGTKPYHYVVFNLNNGAKLGAFDYKALPWKGLSYFTDAAQGIVYVIGESSKKMIKANYLNGEVELLKAQDWPLAKSEFKESANRNFWEQNLPLDQYIFFDKYVIEVSRSAITLYRKIQ